MSNLVFTGQRLPSAYVADFDKLLERATAAIEKPRPFTARVSRTSPTAFVFLLDQSGSMQNTFDTQNGKVPKAKFLANAVNDLLNQLISEWPLGGVPQLHGYLRDRLRRRRRQYRQISLGRRSERKKFCHYSGIEGESRR